MRLIIIALIFISCDRISSTNVLVEKNSNRKLSTENLDTLKFRSYQVAANPEIFETSFFHGTKAMTDTYSFSFYAVDIGKINIESGKIVACDPIVMSDTESFLQAFPIGRYPVQLSIAKTGDDQRVAFSRILFSEKPVVRWEFALQKGEEQVPFDSETLPGYGVDSGIGLFIDEEANKAFDLLTTRNENIWSEVFIDQMDKTYRDTWSYTLYEFSGHSLACFSTGYGDGGYSTFIGYDNEGKICRLLTDFGLVEWWKK